MPALLLEPFVGRFAVGSEDRAGSGDRFARAAGAGIAPKKEGEGRTPLPFQGKPLRKLFRQLVEIEVEREHVDARFAEQSKLTVGDVQLD
jgi:hypothetical protein